MILLSVYDRDAFHYTKTLGAAKYTLNFRWTEPSNAWFLTINDFTNIEHVLTLRLVYGLNLLRQFQHIITGTLVLVETSQSTHDGPIRSDFRKANPTSLEFRYYPEYYSTVAQIPPDS